MFSINPNWFPGNGNWFQKPSAPIPLIALPSSSSSSSSQSFKTLNPSSSPNFAWIGGSRKAKPVPKPKEEKWKKKLERYCWELENRPDYREDPRVDEILKEHPLLKKEKQPTPEEVEEREKSFTDSGDNSVYQISKSAEVFKDVINEMEIKENSRREDKKLRDEVPLIPGLDGRTMPTKSMQWMKEVEAFKGEINEMKIKENKRPYRWEDKKLWDEVPLVPGLDGRPLPRKSIKTKKESDDKFWDFMKHFYFGLWGFKQRPYPPDRPIDIAQAIGYKELERINYNFIMRSGGWYYKDRLGRTRGPLELITLKTAWGGGIIDKYTFIWGEDMDEWAPIGMVSGLEKAITTWDVRLGAASTAFIHKLQKGMNVLVPLKGREKKTMKQLQDEAIIRKARDLAVLQLHGGIWPGERSPTHTKFLWAGGSGLTPRLETDNMPNKFIPKSLRKRLADLIPGLRPWEILSVEQAMERITCDGKWYREPLGLYSTGPPYIQHHNLYMKQRVRAVRKICGRLARAIGRIIPGLEDIMKQYMEKDVERRRKHTQKIEEWKAKGPWH